MTGLIRIPLCVFSDFASLSFSAITICLFSTMSGDCAVNNIFKEMHLWETQQVIGEMAWVVLEEKKKVVTEEEYIQ